MAPHQLLLVPDLRGELISPTRASNKLAPFSENLVLDSAHILVRYGILTVEAFKQTDRPASCYLFEDHRHRGQMTFPELSFMAALNQHLPLILRDDLIAFRSLSSTFHEHWAPTRRL